MRALLSEIRALREDVLRTHNGGNWNVKASAPRKDVLQLCLEVLDLEKLAADSSMSLGLSLETDRAGEDDRFYQSASGFSRDASRLDTDSRGWKTLLNTWMAGKEPSYSRVRKGFQTTRAQAAALREEIRKLVPQALDVSTNDVAVKDANRYLGMLVRAIDVAIQHL